MVPKRRRKFLCSRVSVLAALLEAAERKIRLQEQKLNSTRSMKNVLHNSAKKAFTEMAINTKTATSSINERFSGVSLAFLSRTCEQEFVKNRPKNPVDGLQ